MRQALTEMQIISLNATAMYYIAAYFVTTGVLIAVAFGIYDKWFSHRDRD